MMDSEIKGKTVELVKIIKSTEEYKKREELFMRLSGNPVNTAFLAQYEKTRNELRMAAAGNIQPSSEKIHEFEKLNTFLYSDEIMGEYLILQMRIEQMVSDVIGFVLNECRINPDV